MFALIIDSLEKLLAGLVIINNAPDNSWVGLIEETVVKYKLPNSAEDIKNYMKTEQMIN
ncbi:hypothetical protein [Rickettsia endosymbiont of Cantharis rufa]|uniref:hypothetical protein n=1 Tax=Rickettsia endosymbiont of Cantharis rufa TaxID=3066248 RepID=UPI003132DE38